MGPSPGGICSSAAVEYDDASSYSFLMELVRKEKF